MPNLWRGPRFFSSTKYKRRKGQWGAASRWERLCRLKDYGNRLDEICFPFECNTWSAKARAEINHARMVEQKRFFITGISKLQKFSRKVDKLKQLHD